MDKISPEEIKRAMEKYDKKSDSSEYEELFKKNNIDLEELNKEIDETEASKSKGEFKFSNIKSSIYSSQEFKQFLDENKPAAHTWYEKCCKFAGNIIKINPGKSKEAEYKEAIATCHMDLEPEDTFAFAIIGPIIFMIAGIVFSFIFLGGDLFFLSFFMLSAISIMIPLTKLPFIFANIWRLKSSKEIVLAIFYIVTYMRQNSNLEKAIEFASQHLSGPLAIELKKVLWDVEAEKYSTIKESLDMYMEKWRKTNNEFLESMNLIESSLFESNENNRIALLDKALDVILSETYEKMLHYTHDIQSPISTLHMLGVILPILGLVILPLVVSFMENVMWYHISILYNVVIPVSVYFVGKNILSTRPGGYGSQEISEENPLLKEKKAKGKSFFSNPLYIAILIFIPLFLMGISPILLSLALGEGNDFYMGKDEMIDEPGRPFLDYRETVDSEGNTVYKGPYGIIATVMGIFLILSFSLSIGVYYVLKTKNTILIRNETKELEAEFGSAIFQLGNRLGDGIPLEMSFSKVVEVMQDSHPGRFFSIIDQNIRRLGYSPEQAIFDEKIGAIQAFPSALITSTMKVLTEAIKKGPLIAARAMANIARYVKEMHSVEERLKDLLSEVISSMTSLIKFLAPVISGIVVGITAMITNIIGSLSGALTRFGGDQEVAQAGAMAGLVDMFGDGIPTYYFQIVVGLYIVQITYIISKTISGVSNGDDKVAEQNTIGWYMIRSTLLYAILAAAVMLIFNEIAMTILGNAISAEVF
ncbi:MAG: hypothetical protein ACMXX5_01290 [Candidatus Woesearchaeota archaeon]